MSIKYNNNNEDDDNNSDNTKLDEKIDINNTDNIIKEADGDVEIEDNNNNNNEEEDDDDDDDVILIYNCEICKKDFNTQ